MYEKLAREFMAATKYLLKRPAPWIKNGRLLVEKDKLVKMLNKNPYMTPTRKLTAWRELHWIDTDEGHFTRPARDSSGKLKRVVMVNLGVYRCLEELRL